MILNKIDRDINSQIYVLLCSLVCFVFGYAFLIPFGSFNEKYPIGIAIVTYISYHVYPKSFLFTSKIMAIYLGGIFFITLILLISANLSYGFSLRGIIMFIYLILSIGSVILALIKWGSINILLEFAIIFSLIYLSDDVIMMRNNFEFWLALITFIINSCYLIYLLISVLIQRKRKLMLEEENNK